MVTLSSTTSPKLDIKLAVLLSLLAGNKKLAELKDDVNALETSILHVLKEFERQSLTTKSGAVYALTSLGLMEAQIYKNQYLNIFVVEKFREYWLNHDIKPLSSNLVVKIGALNDSYLICSSETDLSRVYENFNQMLKGAKKVSGVSPIFHPMYVQMFERLLGQGVPVELILTHATLTKILTTAPHEQFLIKFQEGLLKIYYNDNLRFALTLTDATFGLGLFSALGGYDDKVDLVSISPQAIAWGEELFLQTLKDSVRVELKDVEELVTSYKNQCDADCVPEG